MVVGRRTPGEIVTMARTVDLVHVVYYLVLHLILRVSDALVAARLMSTVAFAATSVVLVRIGRRLGSVALGVVAALVLLTDPLASRYAQEARSPALATLLGALATLAFLAASGHPERFRGWAVYGAVVVLAGLTSVLALLLLTAHAALLVLTRNRRAVLAWAAACLCALVILSPFMIGLTRQQGQLWWLSVPHLGNLRSFAAAQFGGSRWITVVLAVMVGLALLVGRPGRPGIDRALLLGISWALLPPLVLWLASRREPLWHERYLLPAVPGTALAVAAALLALSRRAVTQITSTDARARFGIACMAITGIAVLAVSGSPVQFMIREPLGHSEDVDAVADYLALRGTGGDGVLYVPEELRIIALLHPDQTGFLADPSLDASARQSATVTGREVPPSTVQARMTTFPRLWLIHFGSLYNPGSADPAKLATLRQLYAKRSTATVGRFDVDLYVRR